MLKPLRQAMVALLALLRWWSSEYISVRLASVYLALFSALFFVLGTQRAPENAAALQEKLEEANHNIRLFADEITRRNGLLNNMRARDNLNKKTIDLLSARIANLEQQSLRWQEETVFYQHVLEDRTPGGDIVIHALDASPDFSRQGWKLSAILARPGKRRAFVGGYYFEVVTTDAAGAYSVTRVPPAGAKQFRMEFYEEIEHLLILSPDSVIDNVRVVILDSKGHEMASSERGSRNYDGQNNGTVNGAANGGDNGENGGGDGGEQRSGAALVL